MDAMILTLHHFQEVKHAYLPTWDFLGNQTDSLIPSHDSGQITILTTPEFRVFFGGFPVVIHQPFWRNSQPVFLF